MALKLARGIFMGTGGAVVLTYGARKYRDFVFQGKDECLVHHDKSVVKIPIKSQVPATVQIVHPAADAEGKTSVTIVDKEKYNEFVLKGIKSLDDSRLQMHKQSTSLLVSRLETCFEPAKERVDKFADWYFAYSTSFKLIRLATSSLARHAVNFTDRKTLSEAVTLDLDNYLSKQYERIVLRPEITDADIQEAYIQCVKDIHKEFIETVRVMEGDLMNLLASETSHLIDPTSNDNNEKVILSLDWASQLQKIKNVPSNFEKTPELTVALSAGGAILGKTIGTAVGGKAAAGTVGTKVLGGKLASPFVTKAMTVSSGALAGTLAGPLGTAMGACVGISIDYLANKGIELMQRDEMIEEINSVLISTQQKYNNILNDELGRMINVLMTDAIYLMPKVIDKI